MKNSKSDDSDAILSIMAMCKPQSMGKDEDPFVRNVTSGHESMCIMCTNSQLEKICTDPSMFTFNLGDFSLTVTSHCNLLLQSQRTGKIL